MARRRRKGKRRRRRTQRRSSDIGIVHGGTNGRDHHKVHLAAFKEGLALFSSVNPRPARYSGGNQGISENDVDTLIRGGVEILVAAGGSRSAQAAMDATNVVPIIVTSVSDSGRPADNVAGVCCRTTELDPERLQKLVEVLPGRSRIGVLYNSLRADCKEQLALLEGRASVLGIKNLDFRPVLPNGNEADQIEAAFQHWEKQRYQAVVVAADQLFNENMEAVLETSRGSLRTIPAIYQWREFVEGGGLISYGPNLSVAYKLAGTFVGRLVSGDATIDELPLVPLEPELVINLKRAKELKIDVPPTLLAQANEVIAD